MDLAGRPMLAWSLDTVAGLAAVATIVLVVRAGEHRAVRAAVPEPWPGPPLHLVDGGASRHASETAALSALAPLIEAGRVDVVAIHDAARPVAGAPLWRSVIEQARRCGGALPVVAVAGLVGRDPAQPEPDGELRAVQTPQAFAATALLAAYRAAGAQGFDGTDTAACVQRFTDVAVRAVPGASTNIKVTYPGDLAVAARLLTSR